MGWDDAASTSPSTEDDDHCLPRLSVVRQAGKRSTFWFHGTRRRRRLAEEEGGLRWSSEQPAQPPRPGQQASRREGTEVKPRRVQYKYVAATEGSRELLLCHFFAKKSLFNSKTVIL
jgi:hypothetical protein